MLLPFYSMFPHSDFYFYASFLLSGVIKSSLYLLSAKLCKLQFFAPNQNFHPLTILFDPFEAELSTFERWQ